MLRFVFLFMLLSSLPVSAADPKPDEYTCDDILNFNRNASQLELDQLFSLGQAYDQGRCVRQDYTRAYEIYSRAVERGSSAIGLRLGYFYIHGLGVERNEEKARYWFRSHALASFFQQGRISEFLLTLGFFGDPIPEMMHQEIKRAREEANGPPEVLMRNYRDLLTGNGVFPAKERAISWLYMAVKIGHPEAYYDLAKRHLSGNGVFKSENSYAIYLKGAAERNHAIAQKELGVHYLQSSRETVRIYDALVWLLRARKNGLGVAAEVQAAEQLLDRKHRRWAHEKAADFNFKR
jgi:uncharacterized protein